MATATVVQAGMSKGMKIGLVTTGVVIVGFVAYILLKSKKASATTIPTPSGAGTTTCAANSNSTNAAPITSAPELTSAPKFCVGTGLTSWTIGGVTTTGIASTAPYTAPTSGLGAHSDQARYGVPAVSCVKFT